MSDVETRLRDALAARATTVQGDPEAYAAVVRRRERRGVRRLVTVGVAAASVAAVALTVAVVRPVPEPTPPASPAPVGPVAPAPESFVGVEDGMARLFASADNSSSTAGTLAGYRVTAVAALGDGRSFFFAALKGCASMFNRMDVTENTPSDHRTVAGPIPGGDVAGRVMHMAVSPDGARLAYALRLPLADGRCGNAGQIRVRDLRTGAEQSWDDGRPVTSETSPFVVSSLTWSADGRRLSLGERIAGLDTTQPGAKVEYLEYENHEVPGYEVCTIDDRLFRGATGRTVLLLRCIKDLDVYDGASQGIAFDFDPVTGRIGEQLFALPLRFRMDPWFLSFDSSGDHAFLGVYDTESDPAVTRVHRWDRGAGIREVDLGGKDVQQIAW
ncbi:MAG TPA: hypothetical protein VNQ77_03065 [Frankiaceae bacterium]|nr:hypothetical protein [Frankiaceae bacterium]